MNNTFTSTATHLIITDTNMKTMAALLALHSMGNALILKKIVLPMLENDSLLMVSRVVNALLMRHATSL